MAVFPGWRRRLVRDEPGQNPQVSRIRTMIVSANQPNFCPFPGFFAKACLADVLVILDDVQFPQGTTWINRNRFKHDQGTLWLTIPVWKTGLGLQNISQVRICYEGRWPRKHLQSLTTAYGNAPYLADHLTFLEEIFTRRFDRLLDLNLSIIRHLMDYLEIDTRLVLLSELGVRGKAGQLLVEICQAMGASTFLAQVQAKKYLDAALFQEHGIELRYFTSKAPIYPQLWGDFLPNLSTFDLVFNCGPKARPILRQHCHLANND
jgi:WbqC-like protein family